mgnify:CR=1 FL=1
MVAGWLRRVLIATLWCFKTPVFSTDTREMTSFLTCSTSLPLHLQIAAEVISHLAKFLVAELDKREGVLPDWIARIRIGLAAWNDMPVKVSNVVTQYAVVYLQGLKSLFKCRGYLIGIFHELLTGGWV